MTQATLVNDSDDDPNVLEDWDGVSYKILVTPKQISPWIEYKSSLPQAHQKVVITNGKDVALAEYMPPIFGRQWEVCGIDGHQADWDFDIKSITHWMPVPELPYAA